MNANVNDSRVAVAPKVHPENSAPPVQPLRRNLTLIAILFAHLLLLVHCAVRKSICFDEGAHLSAGLAYLRFGEMSIYDLSPPLVRMWAAIPAYLAHPNIPPAKSMLDIPPRERHWVYFDQFQKFNLERVHEMVLWARFMLMPFSLATALVIFFWTKKLYGDLAALIACAVWCFSPTIIAQGSTLGTDMPTAFTMLIACGLWLRFLRSGKKSTAIWASIAIALAHTMKFTALLLWPILIAITIVEIIGKRARWREILPGSAISIIFTFVAINGVYGFKLMGDRLGKFEFDSSTMRAVQHSLPSWLPVPFNRYLVEGFDAQKWEAEGVYVTALFDEAYFGGDWRYYPWLILTKTTVGGLLLLGICIGSFFVKRLGADELPPLIFVIVIALGTQIGLKLDIGIRYLLPLYAPAIILLGRSVAVRKLKPIAIAAVIAIATETIFATPRFHSFVNVIARPWRADVPDLDWGQSLIELRDWMLFHYQNKICLLNLGPVDPKAYQIETTDPFSLPTDGDYVAISRTLLSGIPARTSAGFAFVRTWRELRAKKPAADLGGLVIYRTADVQTKDGKPWAVLLHDWNEALKEPTMIPLRNFYSRLSKGD
jgi:hypothetical protein